MSVRLLALAVLALTPLLAAAADTRGERLAGRPLSEALRVLEARGLNIIFSTELVRPGMRVVREPRAKNPRKALVEILAPHGLAVRRGPGGRLLVVSTSKARDSVSPASTAPKPERIEFHDEVVVAARPDAEQPHTGLSLPSAQVSATAGGLENVFHTLQLLPGVTAPQEFGGRLAVRGGGPDENLIVMDGVVIHNPYRLLGLTSAFNPETVESFELFTGAFSARYGDRLSSLLVVDNRNGSNARGLQGAGSVGLTDSNIVLEGRLPGARPGSWLATARRTYYDLVAERFVKANLPGFTDVQAKGTWERQPGERITLQGLVSREGTDASAADFGGTEPGDDASVRGRIGTAIASGTWDVPLGRRARLRSLLSLSNFSDTFELTGRIHLDSRRSNEPVDDAARNRLAFARSLSVRDLALREELTFSAGRHAIQAGFEAHGIRSRWSVANTGDTQVTLNGPLLALGDSRHVLPDIVASNLAGTRWGAWFEDRWQPAARLTLSPGVRLDHVGLTGEALVSPRLAATLAFGPNSRVKLAAGLHFQSPGYEKQYLGDDLVVLSRADGLRSERAVQAVVGFEHDFRGGVSLRLETYRRRLDRLIVGRLETETERAARVAGFDFPPSLQDEIPAAPAITPFPVNGGGGAASGVEVLLARKAASAQDRLSGWLSYSFGVAHGEAHGVRFPSSYNRRHSATLVGQLRISPRLELAAAVHAASGVPFTPARAVRVAPVRDAADADGDGDLTEWIPARDELSGAPIYEPDFGVLSNTNSRRLPSISRLDVRLSFKPRGTGGRWQFYLEAINVLAHRNGFLVTPQLRFNPDGERPTVFHVIDGGFPRLPSFGVRFRF